MPHLSDPLSILKLRPIAGAWLQNLKDAIGRSSRLLKTNDSFSGGRCPPVQDRFSKGFVASFRLGRRAHV